MESNHSAIKNYSIDNRDTSPNQELLLNRMADNQVVSIRTYINNEIIQLPYDATNHETAESICNRLCKQLFILPASCSLFALRIADREEYLPPSVPVKESKVYEFRLRFQMPNLLALKRLDKNAYNYFYQQVMYDVVYDKIPEIRYPKRKDEVLGLCVSNMYIQRLECNLSIEFFKRNYKKYVPEKHVKKHGMFLRDHILNTLNKMKNLNHDSYYVKGTLLESLITLAPNYLVEKYDAMAEYLPEDDLAYGTCPVELEFSPFHTERPGLSIYYSYKKQWHHITKIEDIFAIIVEAPNNTIRLDLRERSTLLQMSDSHKRSSFISCLAGYYRLSVKWIVDLCVDYRTPSLETLRFNRCHGPIGGEFAYLKLQEAQNAPGSYILRQCEKMYDTFYIDIITKGTHPETFKITHEYNRWHLHNNHSGGITSFDNLLELATSIPTDSKKKFRLAPSEYDKASTLLLCLPPNQLTVKQTLSQEIESELRQSKTQVLNPTTDFRKYIKTQKLTDNGIITEMKADWLLPKDKKLEVTLKILNKDEYLMDFMQLAEKWSNLFSNHLIKLYGFTLSSPGTFVIESIRLGPLDEFLRLNKKMSVVALIDAAYSLARALLYLRENKIVHGKIRCSTVHVIKFESPNMLMVRLGDPGFQRTFTRSDIPWIPIEYISQIDQLSRLSDFNADVWAYATTLWEIFSRGRTPTENDFDFTRLTSRRRLPKLAECPREICNIMEEGWDPRPDNRFSPQSILSRLICAREAASNNYSLPNPTHTSSISINGSEISAMTEKTSLSFGGSDTISSTGSTSGRTNGGSSIGGPSSASGFYDQQSLDSDTSTIPEFDEDDHNFFNDHNTSSLSPSTSTATTVIANGRLPQQIQQLLNESNETIDDILYPTAAFDLPHDGGKIIVHEKIGRGNYGVVFSGIYEDINEKVTPVAIKALKEEPSRSAKIDFEREMKIMQNLNHPNIVRIITHMDSPTSIVMELVLHCSFIRYLNSNKPQLSPQLLFKFAKDIACGMEYLVSKKIVHRDLAARNVLIDSGESVKISDFGLAQVTDSNGYYTSRGKREIPIKWYAPEALRTSKYSHLSDVWSFGITLFEMFSGGDQPNLVPCVELSQSELMERLDRGERLHKPAMCPESFYESVMLACWEQNSKQRPTFTKLLTMLDRFMAEFGESV